MFINFIDVSLSNQFLTFIQILQPLWLFFIDQQVDVNLQQFINQKTVLLTSDEVIFHIWVLHDWLFNFVVSHQKLHFLFHAAKFVIVKSDAFTIVIILWTIKSVSNINVPVWPNIRKHWFQWLNKSDSVIDEDSTVFFHQEVHHQSFGHIMCFVDHLVEHFCWFFFLESVLQQFDNFIDLQGTFFWKVFRVILIWDVIYDVIIVWSDLNVVQTVELVQFFERKWKRYVRQRNVFNNRIRPKSLGN